MTEYLKQKELNFKLLKFSYLFYHSAGFMYACYQLVSERFVYSIDQNSEHIIDS